MASSMNDAQHRDNNSYISQFWYTWTESGSEDSSGGYQVRAVSKELNDILSQQRVKALDWHARYKLPGGTDRYDSILENGKSFYNLPPNEGQLRQLLGFVDSNPVNKGRKLLSIEGAPICLSFAHISWSYTRKAANGAEERIPVEEQILVNKVYVGFDKKDRPGTFFVHILAGLPDNFTARDAIALWRSNIWQTTDPPPSEVGLVIEDIPPYGKTLSDLRTNPAYSRNLLKDIHLPELDTYLSFLIQAYLQQQEKVDQQRQELLSYEKQLNNWNEEIQRIEAWKEQDEKFYNKELNNWKKHNLKDYTHVRGEYDKLKQSQPLRIYIAAKADIVAYLIAKLSVVLPDEWLADLTFSTYENEPEKSSCRIVGTSLPPSSKPTNERPRELLSTLARAREHVLNCYLLTGQDRTPVRIIVRHADEYVNHAVNWLTDNPEELQTLIGKFVESARQYDRNGAPVGSLTVTAYLNAFSSFTEIEQEFGEDKPLESVKANTLAIVTDPKKMTYLTLPGICYKICLLVRKEPTWFQDELQQHLAVLVNQRASLLATLTKVTITTLVRLVNDQDEELSKELRYQYFLNLLPLLQTLSTASRGNEAWQGFLENILTFVQAQSTKPGQAPAPSPYSFVLGNPDIHMRMLAVCAQVFTDPEQEQRLIQVKPLLDVKANDYLAFMQKLRDVYPPALPTRWRQFMIDAQLQQLQRDQRWIALVRLEWTWHALLLSEARDCLAQRDEKYFKIYIESLLEANAGNMGKLLALRLPLVWNSQAVRLFDERSTPVIAKEDIDDLTEHLDSVVSLLKEQLLARNEDAYKEASKFYVKLVKSSFPGTMKLLKALHEMELPNYNVLLDWFLKQTPLSWQEAAELLTEKKEDYKRRDMHVTLLSLYERAQGGYQLMIALLQGTMLREETLDKLLDQARPFSIEEKWAVFQQLPPYIQQYPQSEQIAALYKELTSHTSPYRMPAGGVWLTNRSMSPGERVEQMKQLCRTGQDYASMLQSYLIPTLKSGGNDVLEELAIEFFGNFTAYSSYQESKQELFNALFEVIREDTKRDRLIEAAKFTERERPEFITRYGERELPYFYRSAVTMGVYAAAAAPGGGFSFEGKQRLIAGWLKQELSVDDLERILAASQLQDPPANGMNGQQFVPARGRGFPIPVDEQGWFLDTWGAKCVTLYAQTAPDRFEGSTLHAYIKTWLSNFPVTDFERRKSSVDILTALTGLPTHKYPDLNEVVKAWLAFNEFIEASYKLTQIALTNLGKALQVILKKIIPENNAILQLNPGVATRLLERIGSLIAPKIKDEISLSLTFARLEPYTTVEQRVNILRELCIETGKEYAKTNDLPILLQHVKFTYRWLVEMQQEGKQHASSNMRVDIGSPIEMWNPILSNTSIPNKTLDRIQEYLQTQKPLDWDRSILVAWTSYYQERRPVIVASQPNPVQPPPPQPVAPYVPAQESLPPQLNPAVLADNAHRGVPQQPFSGGIQPQLPPPAAQPSSPSADKPTRAGWWARNMPMPIWWTKNAFWPVRSMKRALKKTDRKQVARLVALWKAHSDTISSKQGEFSQAEWERLRLARDFYVACEIANEHKSAQNSVYYPYEKDIQDVGNRIINIYPIQNLPSDFLNDVQHNRFLEAQDLVRRNSGNPPGSPNSLGSDPNAPLPNQSGARQLPW